MMGLGRFDPACSFAYCESSLLLGHAKQALLNTVLCVLLLSFAISQADGIRGRLFCIIWALHSFASLRRLYYILVRKSNGIFPQILYIYYILKLFEKQAVDCLRFIQEAPKSSPNA